MYELDKQDSFIRELCSLQQRLDVRIKALMEKVSFKKQNANGRESAEINELKLHRYKINEAIVFMDDISDDTWRAEKRKFQKAFEGANQLLTHEYKH